MSSNSANQLQVPRDNFVLKNNVCYSKPQARSESVSSVGAATAEGLVHVYQHPSIEVSSTQTSSNHVKLMYVVVTVLAVMVIASCACIVAAYVEIYGLKSEISSVRESSYKLSSNITDMKYSLALLAYNMSSKSLKDSLHKLCLNHSLLNDKFENFESTITQLITDNFGYPGQYSTSAAASCAAILQHNSSSLSGYYWVRSSIGSAVRVFCDMTRLCGGITGGWMRVADLNMRDISAQCPTGLSLNTFILRTCRVHSSSPACSSVTYSGQDLRYSSICGRITAYQTGSPDAFGGRSVPTIDSNYVDGISLTYGSPRQHIWTFAAAIDAVGSTRTSLCPCSNTAYTNTATRPPAFVGGDYFCDTGSDHQFDNRAFYSNDPLWDGAGCTPQSTCCSFNNPPWFYKQLPQPTTDDIEMRVCHDQERSDEDIAIEVIEIYIQ